jgi:hypothetical protein
MRFWDVYNGFERYWYNIPAAVLINSIFYPDFIQRIHISPEIKEHYLYPVIENMKKRFPNLETLEMNYEYQNTEPTLWRYKPLFDKEFGLVLCRDIDSIPNLDEINATKYFIENPQYLVHTLRTHTNHATIPTIILAGLCGFRPNDIPFIQGANFDQYFNHFKNPNWGLDQNSLIGIFAHNQDWTEKHFLDSPISTNHHTVGSALIKCQSFDQDFYNEKINLPEELSEFLDFLNSQTIWAGEPTDIRGPKLLELLSKNHKLVSVMKECLEECDDKIRQFYL